MMYSGKRLTAIAISALMAVSLSPVSAVTQESAAMLTAETAVETTAATTAETTTATTAETTVETTVETTAETTAEASAETTTETTKTTAETTTATTAETTATTATTAATEQTAAKTEPEPAVTATADEQLSTLEASPESDFEFDASTGKITKYIGAGGDVVIPSTIGGVKVVSIYSAFVDCTTLKSVVIPSGVTDIGVAFSGCTNLSNVTIPEGVIYMDYAFQNCTSLKSVNIPNTVFDMSWAFTDCSNLTTINIPSSVGDLYGTFTDCSSLKNIEIQSGNLSSLEYTFQSCTALETITIPEGITKLDGAFTGCTSLKSVSLPKSLNTLNDFFHCSSLTTLNIPEGVTNIIFNSFGGLTSLNAINVDSKNSVYASVDGVLYNKAKTELMHYPGGKKESSIVIADGVTDIKSCAFYDCNTVKSITVPASVTKIANDAFYIDETFGFAAENISIIFEGNSPKVMNDDYTSESTYLDISRLYEIIVNYQPEATGFTTPEWKGVPCYPIEETLLPSGNAYSQNEFNIVPKTGSTPSFVTGTKLGGGKTESISAAEFKKLFTNNNIVIKAPNGTTLIDTAKIYTGCKVYLNDVEQATIVIKGAVVEENGKTSVRSLVIMANHILGSNKMTDGAQQSAADTNSDSAVNVLDMVQAANNILG